LLPAAFALAGHVPWPLIPILFFVFFRLGVRRRHRYP
jgi:hypothetical protein